MQQNKTLNKS